MSRKVIHADALDWLDKQRDSSIPNIFTGIPDMDEVNLSFEDYVKFFTDCVDKIFSKAHPDGYTIFVQTDRKINRSWFDKSALITSISKEYGFKMVWHKIVLLRDADSTDLHRPTYSHMLGYTKTASTGSATPDVILPSARLYKNGTPMAAVERGIEFISKYSKSPKVVVDPFVGRGTVLAVANKYGLDAVGVDIDEDQVKFAMSAKV
jgi:DNA modification methylase